MGRDAGYCRFVRNHLRVDRGGARRREGVDSRSGWSGVAGRLLRGGVEVGGADVAAESVPVANVQRGQSDDAVSVWGAERRVVLSPAGSDPGATLFGYGGWRRAAPVDLAHVLAVALVWRLGWEVWSETAAYYRAAHCGGGVRFADAGYFGRILLVECVSGCCCAWTWDGG